MGISLLAIVYVALVVLVEVAYGAGMHAATTRKIAHAFTGIAIALLPLWLTRETTVVVLVLAAVLVVLSARLHLFPGVHRGSEHGAGVPLFPLGLGAAALISWPTFSAVALIVGLADGLASIVGRGVKSPTYSVTGVKSIAGSVTFALVSFVILAWWGMHTAAGLGVAFVLTVIEGLSGRGWDNFTVPVAAAVLLRLLA